MSLAKQAENTNKANATLKHLSQPRQALFEQAVEQTAILDSLQNPVTLSSANRVRLQRTLGNQMLGRLANHEYSSIPIKPIVMRQSASVFILQRSPPFRRNDEFERNSEEVSNRYSRRHLGRPMSYREAFETVGPPRPVPQAAQVQDTTQSVRSVDRERFDDLHAFLRTLPDRLRALISLGDVNEAWLTESNVNIQSVLRVLDNLVADLNTKRFIIRFDQAVGTSIAASYDILNNVMHIMPFTGIEQRASVAVDLVHEYTHVLQDRDAEAAFARQSRPHVHTREEDLQREIAARRGQVYFGELLRLLGVKRPTSELFTTQLSDRLFRGRFEQERMGNPKRSRRAASEIRSEIEKAYKSQLQTQSSIKTYAIEIDQHNHALLHLDRPSVSNPNNLGEIPGPLRSTIELNSHLEKMVKGSPHYNQLFRRTNNQRYNIITFAVIYDQRQITEFGLNAPSPESTQ